jgi:hypothetical protein
MWLGFDLFQSRRKISLKSILSWRKNILSIGQCAIERENIAGLAPTSSTIFSKYKPTYL